MSSDPNVETGSNWLIEKLDPEGDFVEAIGRQHSAEKAAKIILEHMSDWKGERKR